MYKELDIEDQKNILTRKFSKAMERKSCEAVALGIENIIHDDIFVCVNEYDAYNRMYSLVAFLKDFISEMDMVMRTYLVHEWNALINNWEYHAGREKQRELDEAKESQWETNS